VQPVRIYTLLNYGTYHTFHILFHVAQVWQISLCFAQLLHYADTFILCAGAAHSTYSCTINICSLLSRNSANIHMSSNPWHAFIFCAAPARIHLLSRSRTYLRFSVVRQVCVYSLVRFNTASLRIAKPLETYISSTSGTYSCVAQRRQDSYVAQPGYIIYMLCNPATWSCFVQFVHLYVA
jgi:hypothetical protein